MQQIKIELYFPTSNLSFETLEGEYNRIRKALVGCLVESVTTGIPDLRGASRTQVRKLVNQSIHFRLRSLEPGSWELILASMPLFYFLGRIVEKFAVETLQKNKNYAELQSLLNEWLDRYILDDVMERLRDKLKGKPRYSKVIIERKGEPDNESTLLVRIEMKEKSRQLPATDEEAEAFLKHLMEEHGTEDDT